MIIKESILKVVDNSGALSAKCIGLFKLNVANLGDIITVSIIKALANRKISRGEVHRAIIVRTKTGINRLDGSKVQFNENALILIESIEDQTPKGTRIFGPLPIELSKNSKIAALTAKFI